MGGGFAGVAAAWHLLALTSPRPVDVHLFDGAGLAGGASGAAAGLLHPFSPKGKVRYLSHHQSIHDVLWNLQSLERILSCKSHVRPISAVGSH